MMPDYVCALFFCRVFSHVMFNTRSNVLLLIEVEKRVIKCSKKADVCLCFFPFFSVFPCNVCVTYIFNSHEVLLG
jgi:hypothetical protein